MKNNLAISLVLWPTLAFAQQGQWEVPAFNFGDPVAGLPPVVAVHLIHLHTGQVVACTYVSIQEPNQGCDPVCAFNPPPPYQPTCVSKNYLWTPPPPDSPGNPGQFQSIPNCHNWLFCVGHSAMADGRILFAGSEWADLFVGRDLS